MFKKILSITLLTLSTFMASAQQPAGTPLPLNPAVKHGTLPNGLNYYIMHNEEPKERVNFYIAQKVGSTLETPEQLGLAHFLEHMAFNGTTNYPGKNMLNYLQSKGIRFGSDINAYTGFDETVYRINNVPSTDKALVDSVLLVLHDWSGSILLEEDEINAERGVIEEEWRSRNNAFQRMYEAALPVIYQEYQYQQMPIGKMEVVRNFPPQVIRDYYHKWYRPDQQGIIIVGDVDVNEIEKKVIDLFSTIPMPENAAERTYPSVSDNQEPIFFAYQDKEMQFPLIMVSFKSEKTPVELRNTVENFAQSSIIELIISQMINNRLEEYSKEADCKYAQASVDFGNFLISKTKAAFNIEIVAKSSSDVQAAYEQAIGVVARACKTGFTQSEVTRARDILLANFEKAYNERNNTNSNTIAQKIIRNFIDNEPYAGAEQDYQIAQMLLQVLPLEAYNEVAGSILTAENQVIIVGQPQTEGMTVVSKEVMTGALNNAINAQYEAYVDEVITDPLIANLPAPGKVVSVSDGVFGTKVLTLSNGIKVILKTTDFKQDEILMTAFRNGGKVSYPASDGAYVCLADNAFEYSKQGTFNNIQLQKYLSGKNVNLSFNIGTKSTLLDGSSSVKDINYLMELVYSSFTQLNPDVETYNSEIEKIKSYLANFDKNQQMVFSKMITNTAYGKNPLLQPLSLQLIESSNYEREFEIVKEALANPKEFTFIFTGNIDVETLTPLVEKYIASMSVKNLTPSADAVSSVDLVSGDVKEFATLPMSAPSTMVYVNAHDNNIPYNVENLVKIDMVGDILEIIFTDTLREEEGGTYSPSAYSTLNGWTGEWQIIYVFQTNDQMQDKLIKRANDELMKLLNEGADQANFNKVKEAALKQYEIKERSNNFWSNNLFRYEKGLDDITNHKAAIENLTLEQLNAFMKTLYNGKNKIEVILQGVAE
ncbi:MAG: insulinase family protein [Bacteroidales bacterium]|nr:insulinase family protein [Bacteroidales bacterium]MBD5301912.1 insulinase family protein [Bacteroides sp.]